MFMKIFRKTRACLILVIILKIHDFLTLLIKKMTVKIKDEVVCQKYIIWSWQIIKILKK